MTIQKICIGSWKIDSRSSAQAISEVINQVTRLAFDRGDYIFFTIDAHEENDVFHPESKLFPPHNLIGTSGRNLYGKLAEFYQEYAGDSRVFWMDKRHYSAFSGTDLDIRLRERRVDTVILTGVLTDICVLHTAIDAYNLGYQIEVVKPAVASIWPENHQFALGHFKNTLGAKLLDENLVEIKE